MKGIVCESTVQFIVWEVLRILVYRAINTRGTAMLSVKVFVKIQIYNRHYVNACITD